MDIIIANWFLEHKQATAGSEITVPQLYDSRTTLHTIQSFLLTRITNMKIMAMDAAAIPI